MEEFLRQFFLSKILLPFWSNSCFFAIAIAIQWLLDLGPEKLSTTAKLGACVQKVLICHWDCQIITNYQSIGISSNNHKLSKHRNIVFHKTKSLESVCWYLSLTLTAVAHKLTKLQTGITTCPFLTVSSVFFNFGKYCVSFICQLYLFYHKNIAPGHNSFFFKANCVKLSVYRTCSQLLLINWQNCKLTNHYLSFSHRFLFSSLVLSQEDRKFWINTLSKLGQGSSYNCPGFVSVVFRS